MTIAFPVAFEKMSGTGNDFIIIDHRTPAIPLEDQPEFARKVCRRKFSIGADGLILVENSDTADFGWRFYNADGSIAEMCGNGARCAARFAYSHGIAGKQMSFETVAGLIEAEITEEEEIVSLQMTTPFDLRFGLKLELDGVEQDMAFINTGVPHVVIFVDNKDVPVKKWGRNIRFHESFQPAGTNANFVLLEGKNELLVRTYERGVEEETMACGTGAVASAIIAALQKGIASPVCVRTSGGECLTILFELKDGPAAENVFLQGPARIIYKGQLTAESLL